MVKCELIEYRIRCIREPNTIELDLCEGETIIARESIDRMCDFNNTVCMSIHKCLPKKIKLQTSILSSDLAILTLNMYTTNNSAWMHLGLQCSRIWLLFNHSGTHSRSLLFIFVTFKQVFNSLEEPRIQTRSNSRISMSDDSLRWIFVFCLWFTFLAFQWVIRKCPK